MAQAVLLRDALTQLGVHHPIVFGHSLGAMVAAALALVAPGVPRSLVLASGLYFPERPVRCAFPSPAGDPGAGAPPSPHGKSPLAGRAMWPLWLRILFSPSVPGPAFSALA